MIKFYITVLASDAEQHGIPGQQNRPNAGDNHPGELSCQKKTRMN